MTESSPPSPKENFRIQSETGDPPQESTETPSDATISGLQIEENGLEFQIALDSLATGNLEPLKLHLAKLQGLDPAKVKLVSSEFKEFHPDSKINYIGEVDQVGEPGSQLSSNTASRPRVLLDTPDEVYSYTRLRSELKEIRLLRLGPKDEDGTHHGLELDTFALDTVPNFYALSYVWGNPNKIMPLPCDGKKVMITQNLFRAIHKVFERFPGAWVWADGICINQDDLVERGEQVKMMGEIYSKTALVVAHTGHHQYEMINNSENGTSEAVAAGIEELTLNGGLSGTEGQQDISVAQGEEFDAAQPAISLMNYLSRLWSFEDDYSLAKPTNWSKHQLPETFKIWKRLFNFWSEDWFYRSWVLQEAVLGKKVILIVDDAACSLDFVMQFWERAKKRDTPEILRHGPLADEYARILHLSPVTAMQVLRDLKHPRPGTIQMDDEESINEAKESKNGQIKHECKSKFLDLLALSRINLASDSRDKIYSLLSLASADPVAQSITPNYSPANTTSLLYQEIAKKIIKAGLGPELLLYSGTHHKIPNLPSWAPDWSHQSRSTLAVHLYDISSSSIPRFNFSASHSQKLNVRGMLLDTIRWTAMAWRYYDMSPSEDVGKFAPFKKSPDTVFPPFTDEDCRCLIRDMARRGANDYATINEGEDLDLALARTLVCDTTWRGERTSSDPTFAESWKAFETLYSVGPDESTPSDARTHRSGIFQWVRDHVSPTEEEELKRKSWPFEVAMQKAHKGRRFCISAQNGWMCTAPWNAERGDVLVLIEGCKVPILIREEGGGEDWRIVGDVYIHGIMDGENRVKVKMGEAEDNEVSVDGSGQRFAVKIGEGQFGKFRDFSIC